MRGGYRSRLPWFVSNGNGDQIACILTVQYQVLRYDDGPLTVLNDSSDFEQYVKQNSEKEIQQRREIRTALRALDGQKVYWPYHHVNVSFRPVIPEEVLTVIDRKLTRLSVLSGYAVQSANLNILRIWHTKYQTQRLSYMGGNTTWKWVRCRNHL